jgi:hypothetical protein
LGTLGLPGLAKANISFDTKMSRVAILPFVPSKMYRMMRTGGVREWEIVF